MIKKLLIVGAFISSLLAGKYDVYLQNAFYYMEKSKETQWTNKKIYYQLRTSNYLKLYKMCVEIVAFPVKDLK